MNEQSRIRYAFGLWTLANKATVGTLSPGWFTSRCAILALCVLPVAFHAEAQDATIAGTLVSDDGVNAPIAGKITLHRVGRGPCGWENPPPGKRIECDGTYPEDTPDAYFIWQLPGFSVATQESVLDYAPMDITANAGEDYTASSGSLTIEAGRLQVGARLHLLHR